MIEDESFYVKIAVAGALGNIGKDAIPSLEKMIKDESFYVRIEVARALGNIGKDATPSLEIMKKDKEFLVRMAVIEAFKNISKDAMPSLEKMIKDENPLVKEMAVIALRNISKKEMPYLKKIAEDKNLNGFFNKWLFTSKNPLFSTPETNQLSEKIKKLNEITKELKEKFPNDFIGIVVFSSTAKGYSEEESDIDCKLIIKKREVYTYFEKLIKERQLKLCDFVNSNIDIKENQAIINQKNLFYGNFFGDRQQLLQLQKTFLEKVNEKEWDEIREDIKGNEIKIFKTEKMYNLNLEEIEKMKQFIALLRVPPMLDEMLKIIKRRTQKQDFLK